MTVAIRVEGLNKKYVIRHEKKSAGNETLRDAIVQGGKYVANKIIHPFSRKQIDTESKEEFWALKDINIEIKQGDKVGIIGRNGAGKSTLLKVISRITEPTSGKIHINGRIASLLEVGTGFHPELTGRENIYLNGAILGMSRREVKTKFDEIVAFSEVEKFLDTPVKRYSSGMYVRLAFAVAAHLEPEILVVDEVLAVGDVEFQKKCLGKMKDVSKEGRTILFVSHNMNAIDQLCDSAILLNNGSIIEKSNITSYVINRYINGNDNSLAKSEWANQDNSFNDENFKPLRFMLHDSEGKVVTQPTSNNDDTYVIIEGDVKELNKSLCVGYAIFNENNDLLYWSYFTDCEQEKWIHINKGYNILRSKLPKRLLNQGVYRLELLISLHFIRWIIEPQKNSPCIFFTIQGGLSDSPYWMVKRPGILAPVLDWEHEG
jgi:lipopolysaccharide transport system ATP-binding protein